MTKMRQAAAAISLLVMGISLCSVLFIDFSASLDEQPAWAMMLAAMPVIACILIIVFVLWYLASRSKTSSQKNETYPKWKPLKIEKNMKKPAKDESPARERMPMKLPGLHSLPKLHMPSLPKRERRQKYSSETSIPESDDASSKFKTNNKNQPVKARFCGTCGSPVEAGQRFCEQCGRKL